MKTMAKRLLPFSLLLVICSCVNIPNAASEGISIQYTVTSRMGSEKYDINGKTTTYSHVFFEYPRHSPEEDRTETLFAKDTDAPRFDALVGSLRELSLEKVKTFTNQKILSQPGGSTLTLRLDNKTIFIDDSGSSYVRPAFTEIYAKAKKLIADYTAEAAIDNLVAVSLVFAAPSAMSVTVSSAAVKNAVIRRYAEEGPRFTFLLSEGAYDFVCELDPGDEYKVGDEFDFVPEIVSQRISITKTTKTVRLAENQGVVEFIVEE